ncbi:MAG: hypothetical protein V3S93_03860 [Methyloceanibacter sp.]
MRQAKIVVLGLGSGGRGAPELRAREMDYEGPRFDALRNALYHSEREAFYDRWNRLMSLVIVVAGAAAISDFTATLGYSSPAFPAFFAALATAAAAVQLVYDLGGKAAKYGYYQQRYYELIADMQEHPGDKSDPKWEARLIKLYVGEPAPKRAADAVAYNAACEAVGTPKKKRVKITCTQSFFRNVWPYNNALFPYVDQSAKTVSPCAWLKCGRGLGRKHRAP